MANWADAKERQALLVHVGGLTAALPVDAIAEVFAAVAVAGPSSGALSGHVNVRGEVLPVVQLRSLLGEPARPLDVTDLMVLVDCAIGRILVVVDDVIGLAWVAVDAASAGIGPDGTWPAISLDDGQVVTLVEPATALHPVVAVAALPA